MEVHPLAPMPGELLFTPPEAVRAACKAATEDPAAPRDGYAPAFAAHIAGGEPVGMSTLFKLYHFLSSAKDDGLVKKGGNHEARIFALMGGSPGLDWVKGELVKSGQIIPTKQGDATEKVVSVLKVSEEIGMVFGWAIVCTDGGEDYYDTQDDHIPEDAMLKASTDFMMNSRMLGDMHQKAEGGSVVFCFPMTEEIAGAFGMSTQKTGLMIGVKPGNAETLAKFKSGEYTGFSIGGVRIVDENVE